MALAAAQSPEFADYGAIVGVAIDGMFKVEFKWLDFAHPDASTAMVGEHPRRGPENSYGIAQFIF